MVFKTRFCSSFSGGAIGLGNVWKSPYTAGKKTVLIGCSFIFTLGLFQMLSFGPWADAKLFGKTIFELSDYLITNILLPGGGLFMLILAGYILKTSDLLEEINIGEGLKVKNYYKIYRSYCSNSSFSATVGNNKILVRINNARRHNGILSMNTILSFYVIIY